jgi:hypothetical protein
VLFVRRTPAGVFFALGVVAVLACGDGDTKDDEEDDNQFREDVIQCEEAVARLERCCPSFDGSRVLCNYYFRFDTSACGPRTTDSVQPALQLTESRCVLDTSCEDLVGRDVCERAQEARTYTSHRVENGSSSGESPDVNESDSHPPVCP